MPTVTHLHVFKSAESNTTRSCASVHPHPFQLLRTSSAPAFSLQPRSTPLLFIPNANPTQHAHCLPPHIPKKSRLSSCTPSRGAKSTQRSRSSDGRSTLSIKQHPPPRMPTCLLIGWVPPPPHKGPCARVEAKRHVIPWFAHRMMAL